MCTAQVLLAIMAALYACWHGPEGLVAIARRVNRLAGRLAGELAGAGIKVENETWFDTLTSRCPGRAREVVDNAALAGINLRMVDSDRVGISFDEISAPETVDALSRGVRDFRPGRAVSLTASRPLSCGRTSS